MRSEKDSVSRARSAAAKPVTAVPARFCWVAWPCIVVSCWPRAAKERQITTVEGLSQDGELNELQRLFLKHGALQCGYCTPGMLMAATALLRRNPKPTLEEVKGGLDGNLCRCTGYTGIFEAIQACALSGK